MSDVIFRPFRNADPPELVHLWNRSFQGRGVATPITPEIFDLASLAQIYFDPAGLIVAEVDKKLVGFVHVGFCVNAERTALDHSQAVLCAIAVDPDERQQYIGQQLLMEAKKYALSRGAKEWFAGPSPGRDPFYTGIYGGSRPSGFLVSHPSLGPFLQQHGFTEFEQHGVFQKNLQFSRDPVNFKLMAIRRKIELRLSDQPSRVDWWWMVRMGRFESLRFEMFLRGTQETVAGISVFGLDFYIPSWNERAVGLLDLVVEEKHRRKGYAQVLLVELGRRLKEEMITLAEIHVPLAKTEVVQLIRSVGFNQIDTGIVYHQSLTGE